MKSSNTSFTVPGKYHDGFIFPSTTTLETFADGTVSEPSLTFTDDTDLGLYRIGDNELGITAAGSKVASLNTIRFETIRPIRGPAGSSLGPTYSFTGNSTTGIFLADDTDFSEKVAIATGANVSLEVSSNRCSVSGVMATSDGTASSPSYAFNNDANSGMYLTDEKDETVGISAGGTLGLGISSTILSPSGVVRGGIGSAGAPTYSFTFDGDTGMYRSASDEIAFSTGGALALGISPTILTPSQVVRSGDGSAGDPAYSFRNDTNTGMYRSGSDEIAFSTGGTDRLTLGSKALFNNVTSIAFDSVFFNSGSLIRMASPSGHPGMIFDVEKNDGDIYRYDILANQSNGRFYIRYKEHSVAFYSFIKYDPTTFTLFLGEEDLIIHPDYVQTNEPLFINSYQRYFLRTVSVGPGSINTTGSFHEITTTGTADAITLGNADLGRVLNIVYVAEAATGDTAVVTPTTALGFTTITFNKIGDSVQLIYTTGGWAITGQYDVVIV